MAVLQRLEVGEYSLKIVDSFCYPDDAISCRGEIEVTVRDRISCAWSKWRELARLLVNHSILLEEKPRVHCMCETCIAVCCGNLGINQKTGRTAS